MQCVSIKWWKNSSRKELGDTRFLKTVINCIYLGQRNYRTKEPERESLNFSRKNSQVSFKNPSVPENEKLASSGKYFPASSLTSSISFTLDRNYLIREWKEGGRGEAQWGERDKNQSLAALIPIRLLLLCIYRYMYLDTYLDKFL